MSSSYNCYDSQWRSDGYFSEKAFYDKNKPNLTTLRIGYSLLIKEKRILSFICIFFILGITWSSFLLYVHHILPFFYWLYWMELKWAFLKFYFGLNLFYSHFLGFTHIFVSFLYEHQKEKYDKRISDISTVIINFFDKEIWRILNDILLIKLSIGKYFF